WQTDTAAPAWIDAQLHFGQADAGRRVVAGDAVVACQRQFGAAAHAEPVDRGDRGTGQVGDVLEYLLPALERTGDGPLLIECLELLDVGTGNEAGVLRRAEHDALGRIDGNALQQGVQLDKHVLGQRVDTFSGA